MLGTFCKNGDMSIPFETPILIVAWNRPVHARRLVDSLRQFRPTRVWVSIDGPREKSEEAVIQQTKSAILEALDWPCVISTQFHEANLGCREGVASGIEWFFSNVEEGIILEDDLVLGADSLLFLREMLGKYRNEERVLSVSADNSLGIRPKDGSSYFFLGFPHVWGWATWKRAWRLYEANMESWVDARLNQTASSFFTLREAELFWTPLFDRVAFEPKYDSWAWCWAATHIANRGLSVQPSSNLVSNLGFDSTATHTKVENSRARSQPQSIFPLRHPDDVRESEEMARSTYERLASIGGSGGHRSQLDALVSIAALRRLTESVARFLRSAQLWKS